MKWKLWTTGQEMGGLVIASVGSRGLVQLVILGAFIVYAARQSVRCWNTVLFCSSEVCD